MPILSYDKLGRQTRKQNQNGFILAEHFSPSGLLQAQGGGWNNSLTEQQLSDYQPNQTYPIAGTQISRKWQYDKAFNLVHTQWGTIYRILPKRAFTKKMFFPKNYALRRYFSLIYLLTWK